MILASVAMVLIVAGAGNAFATVYWYGNDKSTVTSGNPSVTWNEKITTKLTIPVNDLGYWHNYYRHNDPGNPDYYNPGVASVDQSGYANSQKWDIKITQGTTFWGAYDWHTRVMILGDVGDNQNLLVTHIYYFPNSGSGKTVL